MSIEIDIKINIHDRQIHCLTPKKTRFILITGPSGCGKTTLLRAIAGLHSSPGTIRINDRIWQDSSSFLSPQQRSVGWVPQHHAIFPHLTVQQNLEYAATDVAAITHIAESLDLSTLLNRRANKLSGGEQQRVSIGRALLREPDLLLLDEPLAWQDGNRRQHITQLLQEQLAQRSAIVISHHWDHDNLQPDLVMDLG